MADEWSPDQLGDRDMIAPLLALPDPAPVMHRVEKQGIVLARETMGGLTRLRAFILDHFTQVWADAVIANLAHAPATVFTATAGDEIVGFGAHSGNRPGVFGPLGVRPDYRGRGVGAALLFQCLLDLRSRGYAHAIIGQVGPAAFYEKTCGAILLPAEWPHAGTPARL